MVNRLNDLRYTIDSEREAVHGESIGKAVRDIMRLSSGLEDLKYVFLYTVEAGASQYVQKFYFIIQLYITSNGSFMVEYTPN